MIKYNFDKKIDRSSTCSVKYDLRDEIFGRNDVLPMWVADMDFETPDFIIKALRHRLEHPILGYSFRPESFYESIIHWNQKRHGWKIHKDAIVFSPGIVPALNMLVRALTKKGDSIIVQPPVYFPFFSAVEKNGRIKLDNPLIFNHRRLSIDFDDLRLKAKEASMLILCNPHNPGGSVWTADELRKVAEICLDNDVIILSDEIHSDLVFSPNSHCAMASLSPEIAQRTVTCMAPSKTFNLAGLATSYVVIENEEYRHAFKEVVDEQLHLGMGNIFGNIALEAAYMHGEAWLSQLLQYLKSNAEFATDYINRNMKGIHTFLPEATYMLWLDCRELGFSDQELKDFMIQKAALGFNDGPMFGKGGEGFQRMNIACPRAVLTAALERLKIAVDKG